jgi:hypothetical protein
MTMESGMVFKQQQVEACGRALSGHQVAAASAPTGP